MVKTASLYDNFCKTENYAIYDVIIWVQDGNCKKWLKRIFGIGAFYNITKNQDNPIKTVGRDSFLSPKPQGSHSPYILGDTTRSRHVTHVLVWSKSDQRWLRKTLHKQTDRHYENNGHLAVNQWASHLGLCRAKFSSPFVFAIQCNVTAFIWPQQFCYGIVKPILKNYKCEPMPNMMAALPNIGGALRSMPAKYGWYPMLECRAVTKPRHDPVEIWWGAPNPPIDLSR